MKDEMIDARFYEVGRRIAEFDVIREDVRSLQNQINNISQSTEIIRESLSFNNKEIKHVSEKIIERQLNIENKLYSNISLCNCLSDKYESFSKKFEDVSAFISKIFSEIDELSRKIISLSNSQPKIKSDISDLVDKVSSIFPLMRIKDDKISDVIEEIKLLKLIPSEIGLINQKISCLDRSSQEKIENMGKNLSSWRDCFKKESDAILASSIKKLEDKISEIKVPAVSHFAEKSQLENFTNQLQSISLDVKNALLKSGNAEMQNQIHAKKIENIQLTLKQTELSKQV